MEKTLPSGAKLLITLADFEVCDRLLIAVSKELETVAISLGLNSGNISDFIGMELDKDAALNTIKTAILRLASSTTIRPVLWECLDRVVYTSPGGQKGKATPQTFQGERERGDWPIIAKEVLLANLLPFFPSLSSRLSALVKGITSDQG